MTGDRASTGFGQAAASWSGRARARVRDLPADLLERLTPLAASRSTPQFLFKTADEVIGRAVYRESGFHEEQLGWVAERLGSRLDGGTLVDVGANIGTVAISMVASHGAARALAFEPDPMNYRLLRCNVILNDLEDRVACARLAISDADAELMLEHAPHNLGDHRIRTKEPRETGAFGESARVTSTVAALSLDSALARERLASDDISVVWVDVQGHEGHVLAGAPTTLAAGVPFVVEYWPYGLRRAEGLELFQAAVRKSFSEVVDITRSLQLGTDVSVGAQEISGVASWLNGEAAAHTDLLLLP